MVCTALKTSIAALEATGQVAALDLERLHDTLYALESLAYLQGNMARVRILASLRKGASAPSPITAYCCHACKAVLLDPSHSRCLQVSSGCISLAAETAWHNAVQATDCSFLYFNLEILSAALHEACARPEEAHKLPYLLAAFLDAHRLLDTYPGSAGQSHEVQLQAYAHCQSSQRQESICWQP